MQLIKKEHNKRSKDYSAKQLATDLYLIRREIDEQSIQLWEQLDKTKSPNLYLKIIKMLNHLSERKVKTLSYDLVIADLLVHEKMLKNKEKHLLLKEKLFEAEREKTKIS
jgi:hypothetical protein